jgi:glycosyltransferase involved in cell wall biosynthesis
MNNYIVVIPTYNNFNTIQAVVDDVLSYNYPVIVVDDGSSTPLNTLLQTNPLLHVLRHEYNKGKGEAIITGVSYAKKIGYTHVVTLDGDGQHLASEISKLIPASIDNEIIIGARNLELINVPLGSKFGRWFSNFWACWDTGFTITDSLSGFRIYPISILDLAIKTKRFDWEMEVLVRHAWNKGIIKEVYIECYYPKPEERVSHFRKFKDTMAIVWVHVQMLPLKWLSSFFNLFIFKNKSN